MDEMVTVPILIGFDANKQVGELRIAKSALPPSPNFCFNLGIQVLDVEHVVPGEVATKQYFGRYKLCAVSIATDIQYAQYLAQVGVIPQLQEATQ
jgi:hypothetical protein